MHRLAVNQIQACLSSGWWRSLLLLLLVGGKHHCIFELLSYLWNVRNQLCLRWSSDPDRRPWSQSDVLLILLNLKHHTVWDVISFHWFHVIYEKNDTRSRNFTPAASAWHHSMTTVTALVYCSFCELCMWLLVDNRFHLLRIIGNCEKHIQVY